MAKSLENFRGFFFAGYPPKKHGLKWLKMHFKHNLLFFFESVENEPPPQVWNFPLFFSSFSYFHILSGTASASKNSELYLALVVRKKLALSASGKLALSEL